MAEERTGLNILAEARKVSLDEIAGALIPVQEGEHVVGVASDDLARMSHVYCRLVDRFNAMIDQLDPKTTKSPELDRFSETVDDASEACRRLMFLEFPGLRDKPAFIIRAGNQVVWFDREEKTSRPVVILFAEPVSVSLDELFPSVFGPGSRGFEQ